MRRTTICAILAMVWAIPRVADAANALYFTSSATSGIGKGVTRSVTDAGGFIFGGFRRFDEGTRSNEVHLSVALASLSEFWTFDFAGPDQTLPVVGDYLNVTRFPFISPGHPEMDLDYNSHGANSVGGEFHVLDAVFDSSGNLQKYAVDFIEYENGDVTKWDAGSLRFNSDVPINPVPEPSTFALAALSAVALLAARRRFS